MKKLIMVLTVLMPCFQLHAEEVFDAFYKQMRYLAERDKVIAGNIQNSDTPRYLPRDLYKSGPESDVAFTKTNNAHFGIDTGEGGFFVRQSEIKELKPNGNGVNLDTELNKKSENSIYVSETVNVYNKAKAMMNTAITGVHK